MEDSTAASATPHQEDTHNVAVPPSVEDVPLLDGSFVVLHSLQAQQMNGKTGEVVELDEGTSRYQVIMDQTRKKSILIKPANLTRIPLQPLQIRIEMDNVANRASNELEQANESGNPSGLRTTCAKVRRLLQSCLKKDRCCIMAHATLGQLCIVEKDRKEALVHFRHAVAQFHADVPRNSNLGSRSFLTLLRYELAVCLGSLGRAKEEEIQLRGILEESPDCVMAQLALGQSLGDQGRVDESISALQPLVDVAEDNQWSPSDQIRHVKAVAKDSLVKLLERRLAELNNPEEADDDKTMAYVQQLFALVDVQPERPDDLIRAMVEGRQSEITNFGPERRARILVFCAAALMRLGRFEEASTVLEVANELESPPDYILPPYVKCFVQFQEGQLYEARGDRATSDSEKRDFWEMARDAYAASNATQSDPATCSRHMCVMMKLNPNLATCVNQNGAIGVAVNGSTLRHKAPEEEKEEEKSAAPDG